MKFTAVVAVLAVAAASAEARETNAERFARGLPPLPPARRATSVAGARRSTPSSTPSLCNTGTLLCCDEIIAANSPPGPELLDILGINGVPASTEVGVSCSPISAIGVGADQCSSQPACCDDNSHGGIVAIGCSPVNLLSTAQN